MRIEPENLHHKSELSSASLPLDLWYTKHRSTMVVSEFQPFLFRELESDYNLQMWHIRLPFLKDFWREICHQSYALSIHCQDTTNKNKKLSMRCEQKGKHEISILDSQNKIHLTFYSQPMSRVFFWGCWGHILCNWLILWQNALYL